MIIGLCGFIGTGKNTVAQILCDDYRFNPCAFADRLKDITSDLFDWPRWALEGDTQESREFRETQDDYWSQVFNYDVTPRKMLQKLGTEVFRNNLHQDIWIHSLGKQLIDRKDHENWVITDVRFPNEIEFITKKLNGFIVDVVRSTFPIWLEELTEMIISSNLYKHESYSVSWQDIVDKISKQITEKYKIHFSEFARFLIPSKSSYMIFNDGTLDELSANVSSMMKIFIGPIDV